MVEDEPLLRMMAVDLVEDAGFEAVEAGNATDALHILESRPDIHIVFSDIDLPRGMDGMKLAALVRNRWPPIHLILTSGKARPPTEEMPAGGLFFSKPYKEREIVAAMHRLSA